MEKRQVLLVGMLPLLGEGLQRIFQGMEDVELMCLEGAEMAQIEGCLQNFRPQIVVLAGEKEDDTATHLISSMLRRYEDIPIVWVEMETNALRLYTAHRLPASSSDLINTIRQNSPCQSGTGKGEMVPVPRKKRAQVKRR